MLTNDATVNKLNYLLASELSAYKTYTQATEQVKDDVVREQLVECEMSHRQRVQQIKGFIEELGAVPVEDASLWHSFVLLDSKQVLDKEAVCALEEEEEAELELYQQELETADESLREMMLQQLLPMQVHTHDALSILRLSLQ